MARNVYVAVIGVGLVGTDFISQLLGFPNPSPFHIISLSSSKKSILSSSGLTFSPAGWKSDLHQSESTLAFAQVLAELVSLASSGKSVVLVDNTSSEEVAQLYPNLLRSRISVITPNKKAYSGDLRLYEDILAASMQSGARFLNEATVGAGLPIISTLKDLVTTGDKVCPTSAYGTKPGISVISHRSQKLKASSRVP
jgi:homoserine dehydrogenase